MSDEKFIFNGTNYNAFRTKLMDYLLLHDLEDVMLTTVTENSDNAV